MTIQFWQHFTVCLSLQCMYSRDERGGVGWKSTKPPRRYKYQLHPEMLRIPGGLWGVARESSCHRRTAVLCVQTNGHWALWDTCTHKYKAFDFCSFAREKRVACLWYKTKGQSCKGVQREKLPELVNVTERYVLSFRVLNNPLNSIPALQIHTEKQKIKEENKGHTQR